LLNSVQLIVKINRSEEARKVLTLRIQMLLRNDHLSLNYLSMCLKHRKKAVKFKQFLFEEQSVVFFY